MQGLLRALQGQMKCLPEIFDLWDLYGDYFLRGGFGCFREAKFCWVRGLLLVWPMEGRYVGLQNFYLNWIPFFSCALSVVALSL